MDYRTYKRYAATLPLPLTKEQQAELARVRDLAKANNDKKGERQAIETLLNHSQRLAVKYVERCFPNVQHPEDYIRIGMLGVWRAAKDWEPARGTFGTFAWLCIGHTIERELIYAETGAINIPIHHQVRQHQILSYRRQTYRKTGKWLTIDELASFFEVRPSTIAKRLNRTSYVPLEEELQSTIDQWSSKHTRPTPGYVPIDEESCPEGRYLKNEIVKVLPKVLATLTCREERVLSLMYYKNLTLEDAGAEFEVTRERVRQVQLKALRKLRYHPRAKRLTAFLTT